MINIELSSPTTGLILLLNENEYDGLDNAQLTFAASNGQTPQTTYVSNLTLLGRAADAIKSELLATNDISKYLIVKFYDDCCTLPNGAPFLVFVGRFSIQDIEFEVDTTTFETCAFVVNLTSAAQTDEFTTCLRNTFVPDLVPYEKTHYFKANVELRPSAMQNMLFVLYYTVKIPLFALLSVVRGIIALLRLTNALPNNNFLNAIDTFPLPQHNQIGFGVVDAVTRACAACGGGLNYDAALFGGQFDKLYRIDSAFQPNGSTVASMRKGWQINRPNISVVELLDSFQNCNVVWDVRINAGVPTLHINQKKRAANTAWLDVSMRANDLVSIDMIGNDKTQYAGRLIEYQTDGIEKHGDSLKRHFDKLVDFNTPANPLRKGIETITIPYALARCFADEYDTANFGLESAANVYQDTIGLIAPLYYDRKALMLSADTYNVPKLVIADGTNSYMSQLYPFVTHGYTITKRDGNIANAYQWALQLNRAQPLPAIAYLTSMYDSQFVNDEPTNTALYAPFDFVIVMAFNCDDLLTANQSNKIIIFPFNGAMRYGTIDTVDFDLKTGQMTIKGNC